MPRVLVIDKIHPQGLNLLKARPDITVEELGQATEASVAAGARDADAILIRTSRLSTAAIAGAGRLKVVSRHGVGYDNIDLDSLNARRIPLTVVGSVNAVSVAEHAFFLLLATMRRGLDYDRAVRQGLWEFRNSLMARELAGKALLIVGFGRIGREVASRALAFGMRVLVHDPFIGTSKLEAAVALTADLDAAVSEADAVSLHLPL